MIKNVKSGYNIIDDKGFIYSNYFLVVLVITKPYISVTESTFNYGELGRKKNIIEQQSSVMSQDKEFPIIESYCMLLEKETQNKSNCITNENNNSKNINKFKDKDKANESKIEAKQVQDLKDRVNKILNEF